MNSLQDLEKLNNLNSKTEEELLQRYLSGREREKQRLEALRDGTLELGKDFGYSELDNHFRGKEETLNVILGHANVGKSFLSWYLMLILKVRHDWNWIIFSAENKSADIRVQFVEFLCGQRAYKIDKKLFSQCLDYVYDAFTIIDFEPEITELETASKILDISQKLKDKDSTIKGLIVDPYNSLDDDDSLGVNKHEKDYRIAKMFRKFNTSNNLTTWVNMHAVTEALRRTDKEGYPLPPNGADAEGGGKWFNRADDFMTFHRYVQDSARNRTSEIHVRKIKDTKTGGKPTDLNNPCNLIWDSGKSGFYGFYDELRFNPLQSFVKNEFNKEIEIKKDSLFTNDTLSEFENEPVKKEWVKPKYENFTDQIDPKDVPW